MKPTYTISIPKPCHENWAKMTPTEKGKFCGSCQKEVFDFTNSSSEELHKRITNGNSICGRFRKDQLNTPIELLRKERNQLASYMASLLFPLALFFSNDANAQQETPKTEQTEASSKTFKRLDIGGIGMQHKPLITRKKTVTGTVTDESGLPLPGVNVVIQGTIKGTQTDFDGLFKIDTENNQVLVFTYIGYENEEIKINDTDNSLQITLKINDEILGEVIYMGYSIIDYKHSAKKQARHEKRKAIKNGEIKRTAVGKLLFNIKSIFSNQNLKDNK